MVPWINVDILKLMKERDHALKTSLKTKLSSDRYQFRNSVVKKLQKAKADFFLTMIEKARGNPRIIWNQLKKLTGQQNEDKNILELKVKGKSIKNPAEMVEIFNHHFVDSVETIPRCFPPAYTNVCPVTTVEPVFRIRPVSDSDVMRTIRSLKGIVHPKMKILSSFTHPQVVPNLYECLCSAEHKGRYSEECGKQSSSGQSRRQDTRPGGTCMIFGGGGGGVFYVKQAVRF